MKDLIFKDKIAFSTKFDDVYFNTNSPMDESEYVFASYVDEIWEDKDEFIVAEAGFGAGLNFLTTAKKFENSNKKLHYVSIEKFPLSKEDLTKVYSNLDSFKDSSKKMVEKYPKHLVDGIQRIHFSKNIILDLFFGDIKEGLKELDFKADIWFLDGFAPSKNPEMWDIDVMSAISNLIKLNGKVRTYSSAGIVKRNLKEAGFNVEILEGYADKRQMIQATFTKEKLEKKDVWFSRPNTFESLKKVLIIGGGIAGLSTAFKFQKAGFDVKVAEKRDKVGDNGSGNVLGVVMPTITQKDVALGSMHLNSFFQAIEFYKNNNTEKYANFCGAKEYAFNESLVKRYKNSSEFFKFNESDKPYPSIFIEDGIVLKPHKFCEYLAGKLDVLLNYEFSNFIQKNGEYEVGFKNGKNIKTDIIIFAMGSESEELFGRGLKPKFNFDKNLKISSVRGQVTWIKKVLDNKFPLSAKGYICPFSDGIQLIGATYDRNNYNTNPIKEDDLKNIDSVKDITNCDKVEIIGSKVGFRSYSGDRFPIVGPIHDEAWFRKNYKSIFWTKDKESDLSPKHLKNIYITTAHGARGLSTSIMGAELLLDYVLNRPFCVEKSIVNELNPARFLIRDLKKGVTK